jgi:hypothetical protein
MRKRGDHAAPVQSEAKTSTDEACGRRKSMPMPIKQRHKLIPRVFEETQVGKEGAAMTESTQVGEKSLGLRLDEAVQKLFGHEDNNGPWTTLKVPGSFPDSDDDEPGSRESGDGLIRNEFAKRYLELVLSVLNVQSDLWQRIRSGQATWRDILGLVLAMPGAMTGLRLVFVALRLVGLAALCIGAILDYAGASMDVL